MRTFLALKIRSKLWGKLVSTLRHTSLYPSLYRSNWHAKSHKATAEKDMSELYYAARPNLGAGIGHQMANWIAGYWYARQFGLKFAHLPFSTKAWENFLGFGQDEVTVANLRKQGYKIRRLPLFEDGNRQEFERNKRIIASYAGQKVVFIAEQDQFYRTQYGVMEDIQRKFYAAPIRHTEHLQYNPDCFNIAIHVRRGDIMADKSNPNLVMRYLSNSYYEKVLTQVVGNLHTEKPIHIWFFSQGSPTDYPEFSHFENLHWCMNMGAQESFLHMVYADLLITSKSSFSYKPALLNRGIKVCPRNFWHGYPDSQDWILVENDGTFDVQQLSSIQL